MKNIISFKSAFILFGIFLLIYLSFPNLSFPPPLPGAYQSGEPADVETPLRRGYYTDLTRQEVMDWYNKQFKWGIVLNYPPEDAQTVIRDQTKSTFLQEIVHPFRESIYINGFEPLTPEYRITINGKHYRQKVIVRFVESSAWVRLAVGVATLGLIDLLYMEFRKL
jgi:hypothetical protein